MLPWQRERAMPLMAYSPIDQGSLAGDDNLAAEGVSLSAQELAQIDARFAPPRRKTPLAMI